MGNSIYLNPALSQFLSSVGLPLKKQEATTLPNLITGTEKWTNTSEKDVVKNEQIDTPSVSTYDTKNVSLASKIKEIQSLLGKKTVETDTQQLEFEFKQSEEFFLQILQKTKTAENNLSVVQKEIYAEIQQKISFQFKIGGSISAESLVGLGKSSEKFSNNQELLDPFLKITQALASNGNSDDWNEFFEGLSGLFSNNGENTDKLEQFINHFFEQWLQKLFPDATIGNGNNSANTNNALSTKGDNKFNFQFQFQMEFKFEMSIEIKTAVENLDNQQDPIVFDLDGDGIELTDVANGVQFDITGKGTPVQTAWVRGGDALLARDRNGNGKIDSGLELFGDQRGAANGFEELRKLDNNNDGFIGPEDEHYKDLVLWQDNGDGISTKEEMFTLPSSGIERIALNYKDVNITADGNNTMTQKSFFIRQDNTVGRVADIKFNFTI